MEFQMFGILMNVIFSFDFPSLVTQSARTFGIPTKGRFWAFEKLVKQVELKLSAWMDAFKWAKCAFSIQTSYSEFMKERLIEIMSYT